MQNESMMIVDFNIADRGVSRLREKETSQI